MAMKNDLADKQREFQASKADRAAIEQQLWETDDVLKASNVELLKDEQRLNEIVHEYERRVDELRYNDQEISKQEQRLDKLNLAIDTLQKDEANLQQDLKCQLSDSEKV